MRLRLTLTIFLLLLCFIPAVFAQTVTGNINGVVIDKSGGALPGVTVTIRNMETGLERVATTNESGFYSAPFLPIGRYHVAAEMAGLGSMARQNVRVDLNSTTVQNFTLAAMMTETITVSADAPHVDVTDGEIKQTMRAEEIMSLPQGNQASFLGLAATFAGYQENPTPGKDNPTLSSGSSVNFNGTGTRGNTFQINGVNNDDSSENQNRQGVAIATIKSFQILSNSFSAEFGRGYGAVVLVQTKSGTNAIDGELYNYIQRGKWNNLDYFAPPGASRPSNHRYQFGGTAGFPIVADTLFAFLSGDGVQSQGDSFVTRGTFLASDLALPRLTLGNDTTANRAWQDSILSRWKTGAPNNPAVNARAYSQVLPYNYPTRDYSARLDWNANASNAANIRYQRSHQQTTSGELIVGENAVQDNRQSNVGVTWTGILSSNTVQEARFGLGLRNTNVNIDAGNDTPIVRINATGVPTFTILGNAGAYPILRNQRDQQLVYNISSARWANHTLKAGTDIRRSNLDDFADNYTRGYWIFNAACGGVTYPNSIAAFMAGCVAGYQRAYGPAGLKNQIDEQNFYVQDDWRPIDSLTLNIGVRDERAGAPKEKNNKIDYFYKTKNYVDPRLGFAYAPNWDKPWLNQLTGGAGRFSIRGGFGIYHGRVFQSIFSQGGANVRFNPPNSAYVNLSGVFSSSNPGFSNFNLADPTNGWQFVPGTASTLATSTTTIDPNLKMPETHQWNLTLERQVFNQARVRLSYVGTYGRDLLQYGYDNLPVSPSAAGSPWKIAADFACAGTGYVSGVNVSTTCPNKVPIADNEISRVVPRTLARRPNPNYGTILVVKNLAKSWYNAGQFEFETGLLHGLMGRMTYTYSKALDTGSEATYVGSGDVNGFPVADNYKDYKRGLSRFDTRHRLTITGSYAIPLFNNARDWVKGAFGGWQLSTVVRVASGTPFTIVDSGAWDFDFDGQTAARPIVVDPKYAGGWHINDPNTSKSKMPSGAFRRATVGDDPSMLAGRNTYFVDGQRALDLGLYKTFPMVRGTSLMVRLDAFNVLNNEVFGFPNNDFASATFGTLNTTNYTPRVLQLGFRVLY
jgi:hypothetical protein